MHRIIQSDVYAGLLNLEDNSVDVAITSPPYWGQRDYGFEGQIGDEEDYREYIGKLVSIFGLLRNKLKDKGIFFLNIGDKYLSKYGKTPLGMIPYKLAFAMVKDGWMLMDIIIWYKPNHMPSSVKNRFVNCYEPVFVFSKGEDNYLKSKGKFSNIIKINLQPTPYGHVAVYPEKLVYNLLFENSVLPQGGTVLDPFAGSGTTLKVIRDMNNSVMGKNWRGIMVEGNEKYIDIIKERCGLGDIKIIRESFKKYEYKSFIEDIFSNLPHSDNKSPDINRNGFIRIFEVKSDYYKFLSCFFNGEIKERIEKDALCFIGCKDFDIETIYKTSLLNDYGWVIRNMIIVKTENNKWFPLFMIVDDNKKVSYRFNYKILNLKNIANEKENENGKLKSAGELRPVPEPL